MGLKKADAQTAAAAYQDTVGARVQALLNAKKAVGEVGCVFTFLQAENGKINGQVKSELEADGWTVVVDNPNRTLTVT